jgi:D-sedoheptulose 7-phosphate isomerase
VECIEINTALARFIEREVEVTQKLNLEQLSNLVTALIELRKNKGRVFVAGNGGSAATAEHFAIDIGIGTLNKNPGLEIECLSLSSNLPAITATANDVEYRKIFSKQLEVYRPKTIDLLIVFSASGNSPNILEVLHKARELGVKTCALTGFDGGQARQICDLSVHVESKLEEYGLVEDLHMTICHAITDTLRIINETK